MGAICKVIISEPTTEVAQSSGLRGPDGTDIQSLWAKYEDIAMHFNDLLMRLRTQALAGIAAISTLAGIFARTNPSAVNSEWLIAAAIFSALALFWLAIFCLDVFYYNKLLAGAVIALKKLESEIQTRQFTSIRMSTEIISEFNNSSFIPDKSFIGVFIFYFIVMAVITTAAVFSWHMHCITAN